MIGVLIEKKKKKGKFGDRCRYSQREDDTKMVRYVEKEVGLM